MTTTTGYPRKGLLALSAVALALLLAAGARLIAQDNPAKAATSADVKLLAERQELSSKLFSGKLSAADEKTVLARLKTLSVETILTPKITPGDPFVIAHTVKKGQTYEGIVRQYALSVSVDFITAINTDDEEKPLREGQTIKLVAGTARAVISKSKFCMDIYLEEEGALTFVTRRGVAVGKDDATPEGAFRIGGKSEHTTWYPPPSMAKTNPNPVKWGQKGYPLGKDGYFMSLRGIDANTRSVKGYGIHGTNDQSSIGKPRSHGCVRVGEKDIGTLFSLFTEGASLVQIVD